jgi:DNA-binding response OmpR family regulator
MENYHKILVADLRSIDAKHMQLMLKRRGCEADTVDNTQDLLNYLATNTYSLIMVSDNLPDESIVEITSKIRKVSGLNNDLPIVVLTNFTIEAEKQKLLNAGADYCLTKPVYNNSLMEVLGNLLELEQEQVSAA